ncbi:iron-sulfur cluster repair di-iron protein [Roseivirga sp. BDSF3-8]|uniref:iron-sulfur cluster repair di-iron protein n=1 Tax=Roseivirga sp. BDSF3-8 TaxID=3241598 RepID=UPI00353246A8
MRINDRKIHDLVGENHVYAAVLYYLGIGFYDYSEKTLGQVCEEKGLDAEAVVSRLESVGDRRDNEDLSLFTYPADLIVAYLKHTHYLFIKEKLPYLSTLIERLPEKGQLFEDLKFIFPLFVEDFIHHIYEEEDTLFSYVLMLQDAVDGNVTPGKLFQKMEDFSIQAFAIAHDVHDDEMSGIRKITGNYSTENTSDILLKVLYAELSDFEKELITHARVENEILFPKALMLEKEVKRRWDNLTRLN